MFKMEIIKTVVNNQCNICYALNEQEIFILQIAQKCLYKTLVFKLENNKERLDETKQINKDDIEILVENGFLEYSERQFSDDYELTELGIFFVENYSS
jgi:predicted transcriptional regulator